MIWNLTKSTRNLVFYGRGGHTKTSKEEAEVLKPVGSVIGPTFRERAGEVSSALSKLQDPSSFPFELELPDGTIVHIGEDMVNSAVEDSVVSGEYFTPHVIEPAFGIDRIIWHILDHNYKEVDKEGESIRSCH